MPNLSSVPTTSRTTLVATHDPAVTALADHTLRLQDGKIIDEIDG